MSSYKVFNYKKLFASTILLSTVALSGCGGGDVEGNQEPLLVCENGQTLDSATGTCSARPFFCSQAGFTLPDDFPADQVPTQEDCLPPDFSGPDPVYFPAESEAVIYYNRQGVDAEYDGWVLHLFNCGDQPGWPDSELTVWPNGPSVNGDSVAGMATSDRSAVTEVPADGIDPIYGAFWILPIEDAATCGNYIVHEDFQGGDQSADLNLTLDGTDRFARMAFYQPSATGTAAGGVASELPICLDEECSVPVLPPRRFVDFSAHWIDETTIAWSVAGANDTALYASTTGGIDQDGEGNIVAGTGVDAEGNTFDVRLLGSLSATTFTPEQQAAFPHLTGDGWGAYRFDTELTEADIKESLKGQLLFIGTDGDTLLGSFVQKQRVLDALYTSGDDTNPLAESAELGISYADGNITVSAWAPTARAVELKVFSAANPKQLVSDNTMTFDDQTGIWTFSGPAANLDGLFYRYSISVFDPIADTIKNVESTDPYSVSLDTDGVFSQFIDLNSEATKPAGWDGHEIPTVTNPEQAVIYEGHIRDFSIRDESTSQAHRGKFMAFTEDSVPVQHLEELANNGLTHFHMLPAFDIATVVEAQEFVVNLTDTVERICQQVTTAAICDEDNEAFVADATMTIEEVLQSYPTNSTQARDLVESLSDADGFNWGYDPHHFNAPEGSYSTDPEGSTRILEMRAMIQALHEIGLRVVMDVVYNHTSESGLENVKSNFDKFVPGYYYRLDPITGLVETASCCQDTAAENTMMGKFIEDSLVQWAQQYKIDSFRFDLMSFHPRDLIQRSLAAVQAIDPDNYFYGEGWEELGGSSANDAIFARATQENLGGTGIGTFNDLMREPLRGASLLNGGNLDRIRAGLAGNLASYQFYNSSSQLISASDIGAYTNDPQENVAYATVHDNETLWDFLHMEGTLPDAINTMADRARAQVLTLSVPLLSQGVSFIHMGSDLLRSKSFEENSFNSGDWFNYIDFTQTDNNWNIGVTQGDSTPEDDTFLANILANPEADPDAATIAWSSDVFNNMLAISSSTPLFNLTSAEQISERVGFHNQGIFQADNMIVMSIDDGDTQASMFDDLENNLDLDDLDPAYDAVVVIFNGATTARTHAIESAANFELHAMQTSGIDTVVQTASFDNASSTFSVPALTTAVFVKRQNGAQGYGLWAGASPALGGAIPNPFSVPIFLRGSMNSWGISDELNYNGDGTFTVFTDITAADYEFKIASEDWSTVDFGAATADTTVTLGSDKTLATGGGNLAITIPSDGEYRFDLNAAVDASSPVLNVRNARTFGDTAIFLRGSMNGWGTANEMAYTGESIYQTLLPISAARHEFKVASDDFATVNLGGTESGVEVNFGQSLVLGEVDDNNLAAEFIAADYLFTLDTSNIDMPRLAVVLNQTFGSTPVFVRGSFNGWGIADEIIFQGNAVYSVDINISAGSYEFKVASEDWSTVNLGEGMGAAVTLGVPFSGLADNGGNLSLVISTDGVYRFTFDSSRGASTLTVTDVSP
ncbi:alpha-1,6-glucosidase domain-containing protein [Agarilytica rhodophyticola]|uniref:alpha-1,6-glucosidase domain-containing protein n=1 Tax=Agarilytica rhodophyticola TaxID=1737490 RepID=UPI000B347B90|nr:alpha-1,6-glucosidase domain-containing protein [Agarilytica rhodophyticola]